MKYGVNTTTNTWHTTELSYEVQSAIFMVVLGNTETTKQMKGNEPWPARAPLHPKTGASERLFTRCTAETVL